MPKLVRFTVRDMDSDVIAKANISAAKFKLRTGRKKNMGEWWSEAGQEKLDREEQLEKLNREEQEEREKK